jgi:glycosyltransferase involved in cell wall biosynthesis
MSPTILMISHVVPCTPAAGNEIRILKMIRWLKKEGYRIIFLLNGEDGFEPSILNSFDDIVDRVHLVGDDYGVDLSTQCTRKVCGASFKERVTGLIANTFLGDRKRVRSNAVKKSLAHERLIQVTGFLCRKYDPCAVIAEYIFAAPCLDAVPPKVLKIVDTHDMFSRKKEQVLRFGIDDPLLCTPGEERNYLLKSDVVIAIQANEARMFRELVPERDVITVGIDYDVVSTVENGAVDPNLILFVGSDNPLNVHGLKEFYRHAWPSIRAGNPDAMLRMIGKIGKYFSADDERVQVAGWVRDLEEEYRGAAVVINPIVAGTGLKIKSVEALCRGKPLVGTLNSVDGLDFDGDPPFLACEDWPEFSETVLRLLASQEERQTLQERAVRFARENFCGEKTYAPLTHKLRSFCAEQQSDEPGAMIG